jgi:hypothetical protein
MAMLLINNLPLKDKESLLILKLEVEIIKWQINKRKSGIPSQVLERIPRSRCKT